MLPLFRPFFDQRRIAGGAFVLAMTQFVASGFGFLRDQAFSVMFPLEQDPIGVASVYIAAFRPSDLLFQLLVMSCLSVVLVPFLASHFAHDRQEEMNGIVTSTMLIFGVAFGCIAAVLFGVFPFIAPSLVKFQGEALELYIFYARIALLTNLLFVVGNTLGQYLIAVQRYWVYGLSPIVWSMSTILGTYFLTPAIGAKGPIVGTLIGTILYVLLRLAAVLRHGYRLQFTRSNVLHPELLSMGLLVIPRMAALGALQLQLLLLDRLASGLGPSMVAVNQFASNFESVIPGIVGIAIAQSSFSLLSQLVARRDVVRLRDTVRKGLLLNVSLSLFGAVVLAMATPLAAWLMNLQGEAFFLFRSALLIYAVAVPFESTNHIILRAFYAFKNTMIPALSSVVSCFIAVTTGTMLVQVIGVLGLAVAYVVAQVFQTVFLGSALAVKMRSK